MMNLLCAWLCVMSNSLGSSGLTQPVPGAPSDASVIKAVMLPSGFQGDLTIVKQLVGVGEWKCFIYFSSLETVRFPWGGSAKVVLPCMRIVHFVNGKPAREKA
jgi:hypothetical protein